MRAPQNLYPTTTYLPQSYVLHSYLAVIYFWWGLFAGDCLSGKAAVLASHDRHFVHQLLQYFAGGAAAASVAICADASGRDEVQPPYPGGERLRGGDHEGGLFSAGVTVSRVADVAWGAAKRADDSHGESH
jgi:hypothetical protein